MPTVLALVLAAAVIAVVVGVPLTFRRLDAAGVTQEPAAPPRRVRAFDFPPPTQPDPPEVRHERYRRACASPNGLAA